MFLGWWAHTVSFLVGLTTFPPVGNIAQTQCQLDPLLRSLGASEHGCLLLPLYKEPPSSLFIYTLGYKCLWDRGCALSRNKC